MQDFSGPCELRLKILKAQIAKSTDKLSSSHKVTHCYMPVAETYFNYLYFARSEMHCTNIAKIPEIAAKWFKSALSEIIKETA